MSPDEVNADVLASHIGSGLSQLQEFAATKEFQSLLDELYALPVSERAKFVLDVVMHPGERERRGILPPPNIRIQRSAFRDNRPTLFCVVLYIPDGLQWSKVTITYDNPAGPPAFPYSDIAEKFEREVADQTYQ